MGVNTGLFTTNRQSLGVYTLKKAIDYTRKHDFFVAFVTAAMRFIELEIF